MVLCSFYSVSHCMLTRDRCMQFQDNMFLPQMRSKCTNTDIVTWYNGYHFLIFTVVVCLYTSADNVKELRALHIQWFVCLQVFG